MKNYYYGIIFLSGIFGLIYFIFIPNLILLFGATIFLLSGFIYIISSLRKKEIRVGILNHISFAIYIFYLMIVSFIEYGVVNNATTLLLSILALIIGIIFGISIGLYVKKESSEQKK